MKARLNRSARLRGDAAGRDDPSDSESQDQVYPCRAWKGGMQVDVVGAGQRLSE
jgi:hypothetical protein